jgi:hypothetical protein
MDTALELTPQQQQELVKQKTDEFVKLFQEAETKTGMTIIAILDVHPQHGIRPLGKIVPITKKGKTNGST